MSHDRLAAMMLAHQEALAAAQEPLSTHETILGILSALDKQQITHGQALRLLGYQALRLADAPTDAALYRQAATSLRQMQRKEQ